MSEAAVTELSTAIERGHEVLTRKKLEDKLAILEEFNRLLVESTGDCILVIDQEGRVLSINETGRNLLQLPPNDPAPLNRHWTTLFPDFEGKAGLRKPPGPDTRSMFQAASRAPSGNQKFWSITFKRFGEVRSDRFVLIARDITEHVMAERGLRQSEQAFRKIFEENPIGMLLANPEYTVSRANKAICAMLGFTEEELIGRPIKGWLMQPGGADSGILQRLLNGEVSSFQRELTLETRSGQPVWSHLTLSVLRDPENQPSAFLHMVENIQDRKTAEEQVLAYQAQLQTLASEVALGEERERRRIATNLHDQIGQSLAFARLKLASAAETPPANLVPQLRELIDDAIAATRSLTFELSPPVLYELGLVAAIEWLTHKIQGEHKIQTRFHDDGQPKPLDENFRIVLFQAVRELLVNIAKHARARHAQVLLRREGDALRILIEDNGIGFELGKITAQRAVAKSFGLFNIRERVEYLGGRVTISSGPGQGTRVILSAPLKMEPGVA